MNIDKIHFVHLISKNTPIEDETIQLLLEIFKEEKYQLLKNLLANCLK